MLNGGVISESILNLVPFSKQWTKLLSLSFPTKIKNLRDSDLVYLFFENGTNLEISHEITPPLHFYSRDTVSLFSEKVDQNDEEDTDHFENIQSTNW